MPICREIDAYIAQVRSGPFAVCKDQLALCDYVEKRFQEEDIHVDEQQLKRYLDKQKYYPFRLLPWEGVNLMFCSLGR